MPQHPGRRGERKVAPVLAVLLLASACGSTAPPFVDTCPNDVPDACAAPGPSYGSEVAPLLHDRCGGCHTAGGVSAIHSFDTYPQVQSQRIGILSQLHSCLMPPADQQQPTAAERLTIFSWVVCGAMDN